jgi:hypothetical protein
VTGWTAESLPPELAALHDAPGGTSLTGLAGILNAYDAMRPAADAAWAREQIKQVVARYEAAASTEPDLVYRDQLVCAAAVMRLEFLSTDSTGRGTVGRFAGTAQSQQEAR